MELLLGKKKEIDDGLRCRLIWSMDYIYTKPNKQIILDILMSLYSFFYPAEYAEDVTTLYGSGIDFLLKVVCQPSVKIWHTRKSPKTASQRPEMA